MSKDCIKCVEMLKGCWEENNDYCYRDNEKISLSKEKSNIKIINKRGDFMPNWCYTTMEITGSVKQIEKIYKKLSNKDKKNPIYDNINLNIDYSLLSYLDIINIAIKNDDRLYEELDYKCRLGIQCSVVDADSTVKYKIYTTLDGGYTTVYCIEDLLRIMYNNIEHFSSTSGHSYLFANTNYNGIFDHLIKIAMKNVTRHKGSEYCFSNISPDNPISMYRNVELFKVNPITDEVGVGYVLSTRRDKFKCDPNLISWYDSRINRISTKWFPSINACEITEPGTLYISMECAWGPCTNLAAYLTDIYDIKIDMQYSEGGMCFLGGDTIVDGNVDSYYEGSAETGLQFSKMEDDLFGGDGDIFNDNFIDYVSSDIDKDWELISRSELKSHLEEEESWLGEEIDFMVDKFKPIRKIKIKKRK